MQTPVIFPPISLIASLINAILILILLRTIAIEATQNLHLSENFLPLESQLVDAILDCIRCVPVATVVHVPRSIRSLLSQALS